MDYTDLTKTSSVILNAGAEHIAYFTTETADEPGDHGTGGKTFLTGAQYTGTVSVTLATAGVVDVLMRHEDTSGVAQEVSSTASINDGPGVHAVSVTGSVPADRRLTVVIKNQGSIVTVSKVQVRLLSQVL